MSIATEIEDLNTNLAAAKSAITTKGGTVGDTGLLGLTEEILSIPSGGSVDDRTEFGVVYYNDAFVVDIDRLDGDNCTVEVGDMETFTTFAVDNSESGRLFLNLDFQQGEGWQSWSHSGMQTFTTEELYTEIGLKVTDFDESTTEYASIMISGQVSEDNTQPWKRRVVENLSEFNSLTSMTTPIVPLSQIKKFVFGYGVSSAPGNFLNGSSNLVSLDTEYADSLITIGNSFAANTTNLWGEKELVFKNVTTVGDEFFMASGYRGTIKLPEVVSVGARCFKGAYNQPDMPKVEVIGDNFMNDSKIETANVNAYYKLTSLGKEAYKNSSATSFQFTNYRGAKNITVGRNICADCLSLATLNVDEYSVVCIEADSSETQGGSFAFSGSNPTNTWRGLVYRGGIYLNAGNQDVVNAIRSRFPNSSVYGKYRKWSNVS